MIIHNTASNLPKGKGCEDYEERGKHLRKTRKQELEATCRTEVPALVQSQLSEKQSRKQGLLVRVSSHIIVEE